MTAEIKITDASGAALSQETRNISMLMPEATFSFKTSWYTATNRPGTYPVTFKVKDGSGAVIATSSASINILSASATGAGVSGTVTASPSPVYQGRTETFTYTMTNNGNDDVSAANVTIIVADPTTGEGKTTVTREAAGVRMGETISDLVSVSTFSLQPRTYMAVLQVKTDSMTTAKTLASSLFEVKPGIEVTKTIPDLKNVLVWVNDNCTGQGAESIEQEAKSDGNAVASVQNCASLDSLERALSEAGAAYYIVSDKKDFQNELRNPIYTDFIILGNRQPLEDHYAEELREQVYAGKGLISSLFDREDLDNQIFGITFRGGLPADCGLRISDCGIGNRIVGITGNELGIQGTFPSYGKAVRAEAAGADDIIGMLAETSGKKQVQYPAIIKHVYGNGKVLYFAFDLGTSSETAGFPALLTGSLNFIHTPPDPMVLRPNQLVPVEITLKSLGAAFDVQLTEKYPDSLRIAECGLRNAGPSGEQGNTCVWVTDNPWVQTVELASNQTATILYYVRTPDQAASYMLETEVGYLENGTYMPYQTLSTELKVEKSTATVLTETLTALQNLTLTGAEASAQANAIRYLNNVQNRLVLSQKDWEAAIADLEQAVGELLLITSADVTNARQTAGRLLLYWEAEWYFHQDS